MLVAYWHTYQVLTKRPARAGRFWRKYRAEYELEAIPEHIWIGTSIENDDVVYRARHLRLVDA